MTFIFNCYALIVCKLSQTINIHPFAFSILNGRVKSDSIWLLNSICITRFINCKLLFLQRFDILHTLFSPFYRSIVSLTFQSILVFFLPFALILYLFHWISELSLCQTRATSLMSTVHLNEAAHTHTHQNIVYTVVHAREAKRKLWFQLGLKNNNSRNNFKICQKLEIALFTAFTKNCLVIRKEYQMKMMHIWHFSSDFFSAFFFYKLIKCWAYLWMFFL